MKQIGRLLKRADFLRVQKDGRKWVTPTGTVQMAALIPSPSQGEGQGGGQSLEKMSPPLSPPYRGGRAPGDVVSYRYGLTIPKKIWPRAVDRNRVRRRVRAVLLAVLVDGIATGTIPPGTDVVVLPRKDALTAPAATLEKDLKWALKRLVTPEGK